MINHINGLVNSLQKEQSKKFIKPLPIRNVTIGDQNQAWPMILSDKLGVKLSNHAITGTGSLDVLNDFLLKYSGLKTFRWRGVFKNKLVLWAFTYPYRDTFHPFVFNCMEFKDPAHFLKTIYGNFNIYFNNILSIFLFHNLIKYFNNNLLYILLLNI